MKLMLTLCYGLNDNYLKKHDCLLTSLQVGQISEEKWDHVYLLWSYIAVADHLAVIDD